MNLHAITATLMIKHRWVKTVTVGFKGGSNLALPKLPLPTLAVNYAQNQMLKS